MRSFEEIARRVAAAEAEMTAARAELRAYLDGTEAAPQPVLQPETREPLVGERILAALGGGVRLTVADLAQRCGTTPTRAFREALSRLKRTGRVRAVERGVYQAR